MKEDITTSTSTTRSSGYPFHLMNQELGLSLTDHHEKKNPEEACSWWPTLKPFANGGAAAFLGTGYLQLPFAASHFSLPLVARVDRLPGNEARAVNLLQNMDLFKPVIKLMPSFLFVETISSTGRLGSFEILRRKAMAFNDGRPLTLIQEASCGLTAGMVGSGIAAPFNAAYMLMQHDAAKPAAQRLNYRDVFDVLYRTVAVRGGVSTLWRTAVPIVKVTVAFDMGLLASYYPSLNYLKESRGFSECGAQFGAAAISALFASASSLISNGGVHLLTGTPITFLLIVPRVMMTWIFLEEIQKVELSIGLYIIKYTKL